MPPELRLSVLDPSPTSEGSNGAQALRNSLDLARLADERGYHRYWVAEHHGGPMLAGPSPEALISAIGATTSRMRVGSGGIILPHYSPFKVAETFSVLSGLFPGRIDLGLGTDGTDDPVKVFAMRRERDHPAPDDFDAQLTELLAFLDGDLPSDHLFAELPGTLPGRPEGPEPWLMGSSPESAAWAARLGLAYVYADYINSDDGVDIVKLYRERFVASGRLAEPRLAVAVWALCAESDDEAERVAASNRMVRMLARRGKVARVPAVDTALRFIDRRTRGQRPDVTLARRTVHGAPASVRAELEALAGDYGTQELLVLTITHEHETRRRSYELLSKAFSL